MAHRHHYDKVIYVMQGSITFGLALPPRGLEVGPADRLDRPAAAVHEAQVGGQGVICLKAHR